jgi:hypothetical protein
MSRPCTGVDRVGHQTGLAPPFFVSLSVSAALINVAGGQISIFNTARSPSCVLHTWQGTSGQIPEAIRSCWGYNCTEKVLCVRMQKRFPTGVHFGKKN